MCDVVDQVKCEVCGVYVDPTLDLCECPSEAIPDGWKFQKCEGIEWDFKLIFYDRSEEHYVLRRASAQIVGEFLTEIPEGACLLKRARGE